ncbi:DUF2807 domain-containing protein [Qipengyuania sp. 1NDH17]|uniref:DUF2807 domain-containing protein n=1 Tax=Qipengyuania polymorpha TaxID=2867234 RepID=A0ABS7J1X3_9SPHN|nr:head GIN domain-containing protein [Qipengyuania polymorpha]MBX7458757.1 DUF2807 domain-containing protein [Qipengyuania polymorpha]
MIHKVLKGVAPLAALAAGALLAGCNGNITIGDSKGVPLAELDQGGEAPSEIVLAGPDNVVVTRGDALTIDVSGDQEAVDALRFTLDDGALGIMRDRDADRNIGTATVRLTMPSLTAIVLAGSGTVEADAMDGQSDVTIAGSGSAKVGTITANQLDLTIAGSGNLEAGGEVDRLDLTIAGSGSGRLAALKTGRADVTVAGSGDAEFASDGRVEASIMGSGTVTVIGNADCTVQSMGSGKLRCRGGSTAKSDKASAPETPEAPDAPPAP